LVLSVRAKGRTPDQVTHVVELSLAELAAQHAHTAAVVASRCPPDEMTAVAEALRRFEPKSYVLPDEPLLAAPTVAEMQHAVGGTLISGDEALMSREVMGVVVAGMTAEHMLERLTERCGVITPADRSEVVLAVASAHAADGFPSLSGLILNGAMELHAAIADLAIPIPTVITPQMFTHQLLDHARKERKRIVLSEGSDDRILRAARRLLRHRVVDLTILGDETEIRSRAAELGVDLSDAAILDPRGSELREEFAHSTQPCARARVSPSSRPTRSCRTPRISAPCWCTTVWWTAWCRVRRTPLRALSGLRSRSSGPRRMSPRCPAWS
jgi:phosphate acetyltransferase